MLTYLLDLPQLCCRALAINIFFRCSFDFSTNWPQLLILGATNLTYPAPPIITALVILAIKFAASSTWIVGIPLADRQDLFNFAGTLVFLYAQQSLLHQGASESVLREAWISVPLVSLSQLVRYPVQLKTLLRPLRVALGPASTLTAITLGTLQALVPGVSIYKACLGVMCAACSFAATVIFRPDNTQVLEGVLRIVGWPGLMTLSKPGFRQRKRIHACLHVVAVAGSIPLWWRPVLALLSMPFLK